MVCRRLSLFSPLFRARAWRCHRLGLAFRLRVAIAKDIVDDIVSQRAGNTYDPDEDLDYFVNNFLEAETEHIRELVDEMMMDHLEDDNITVKEE